MSSFNEDLLTIPNRLQHLFIILFFLHNRLFDAKLLSLLPGLLLRDVIFSELAQFLLQHQLMVLVAHEIFNLLLTALKFHHDLLVALFDGLAVVSLA